MKTQKQPAVNDLIKSLIYGKLVRFAGVNQDGSIRVVDRNTMQPLVDHYPHHIGK